MVYDCPCLANDMAKIFEVYWYLGNPDATIPKKWPASLATSFNANHPLASTFNGTMTQTYLSVSLQRVLYTDLIWSAKSFALQPCWRVFVLL